MSRHRAHPRWRGADRQRASAYRTEEGSSPLARGGRYREGHRPYRSGLIPAGAGRTRAYCPDPHPQGAHPRWRGADLKHCAERLQSRGSSPLARGGLDHPLGDLPEAGLIPAGAGRTFRATTAGGGRWAHPRWRGADGRSWHARSLVRGSSPLARGGLPGRTHHGRTPGLIPAGAGRTPHAGQHPRGSWAHPRWRGADHRCRRPPWRDTGSSPLARGGLPGRTHPGRTPGLIPAGAGRTVSWRLGAWCKRAHPRWRGADARNVAQLGLHSGSSPLARGGPPDPPAHLPEDGLIPAGAGRTPVPVHRGVPVRAHPRWRGADSNSGDVPLGDEGSSPLARGGLRWGLGGSLRARLIPAGAGRTCARLPRRTQHGAHPRWRGADTGERRSALSARGSSPLARGGRGRRRRSLGPSRLIPAGAGRTSASTSRRRSSRAHPRWRGAD